MNLFEVFQMVGTNVGIGVAAFVLVLSILVFVHEWGHYIIARACGVRVMVFSIGFGKEIWGFNDRNGTRWKVSMIPLGGYVQMFGDTDPASAGHQDGIDVGDGQIRPLNEDEKKVAFYAKPVWQRAAIVFAGPAINYIFAIFLLMGLYLSYGQPVVPPVAAAIIKGSAAEKYGFQPHDLILSISGQEISDFADIRREMMVALDQEKLFVIKRGDKVIEIKASPTRVERKDRFGFKSSVGVLGLIPPDEGVLITGITAIDGVAYTDPKAVLAAIKERMGKSFVIETLRGKEKESLIIAPDVQKNINLGTQTDVKQEAVILAQVPMKEFVPHTMMTAAQSAIEEAYILTVKSLEAIGQMITGTRSAAELGGVIRIGAIAGDMAQLGLVPLIFLTALLSINLGFINLLPIPLLDGGHLLFYFFEAILGRPIPEQMQEYAFRAGMVFLIGIMAFANLNDLIQIFGLLE